jgi:hypothetical protein
MVLGRWLQAACESFLNLSGLFGWHGRITVRVEIAAEQRLKLFIVADDDRRDWSVFE